MTNGYRLVARKGTRLRKEITLLVEEKKPGPGVMVAEATHTPYIVVAITRADLPGWDARGYDVVVTDTEGRTLYFTRRAGPGKER